MPTLPERIAALRAAGITPETIARRAGTHRPTLLHWLSRYGRTRRSLDVRVTEAVAALEAEVSAAASAQETTT